MIERVPDCCYQRLYREVVFQAIDDYLKLRDVNQNTELYTHFLESERLLLGTGSWGKCFDFLCECAGLDSSWVRRRVIRKSFDTVNWKGTPNIGKKVLGLCSFSDISPKHRNQMAKRLRFRLVKH